jgi:hypothetical protein
VIWTVGVAVTAGAQTPEAATTKDNKVGGAPLFSITHDSTLRGDGTSGAPLGIEASPTVPGRMTVNGGIDASTTNGDGIDSKGADSGTGSTAGTALSGTGGNGFANFDGGTGVLGTGGDSQNKAGGSGVVGQGGKGSIGGGTGVLGIGGFPRGIGVLGNGVSAPNFAGIGVAAVGGTISPDNNGVLNGNGGEGLHAVGGIGEGAGNAGGPGIFAIGGLGEGGADHGLAARFQGDVVITGNLMKGGGSFRIDHPLDPANKYLSHSFVESPDMMNIYNGNVTTDANGDALIELPNYFEALNRDFRYQLTVIGTFAQSIVAEKIKENHFRIKTNLPNVEVSWQVTGIRHDTYANENRIAVEEDKPQRERGTYLHLNH